MCTSRQDLSAVRSEIRDKMEAVEEKKEFLEAEKLNAEEVEKKVNMSERQSAKMRLDLQDAETMRIQFKDEVLVVLVYWLLWCMCCHGVLVAMVIWFHCPCTVEGSTVLTCDVLFIYWH
jgi:Flp pilus assembly protein TadB